MYDLAGCVTDFCMCNKFSFIIITWGSFRAAAKKRRSEKRKTLASASQLINWRLKFSMRCALLGDSSTSVGEWQQLNELIITLIDSMSSIPITVESWIKMKMKISGTLSVKTLDSISHSIFLSALPFFKKESLDKCSPFLSDLNYELPNLSFCQLMGEWNMHKARNISKFFSSPNKFQKSAAGAKKNELRKVKM